MTWALHHIGYLAEDLEAEVARWCADFGYQRDGAPQLDATGTARVQFLRLPGADHWLEVIAPNMSATKVSKTLQQANSYHHLSYEVPDIAAGIEALRARGWLLLGPPKPESVFGGRVVAWLMNNRRALVELIEAGPGAYQASQLRVRAPSA